MDGHDQRIIHSSVESNWRTPPECFIALHAEFGFELDAAANAEDHLLPDWFGPGSPHAEDALAVQWDSGTIFVNPPYSKTLVNAYNTGRIKVDGQWVEHEKDPAKALTFEIESWAKKCWAEAQTGATIVGLFPFAPQTDWYRKYVMGHPDVGDAAAWFFAAAEERRLPHRISFLRPDGSPAGNAGVNTAVIVWRPCTGRVGPWSPASYYWSYR